VPGKQQLQQENRNFAPKIRQASRKLKSLKHEMCLISKTVQTSIEYQCILRVAVTPLMMQMLSVYSALVLTPKISMGDNGSIV
jgi:hypothetical protein